MDLIVYLNGNFVESQQAQVSVLDRGFVFGDGVYELIPCYSRKCFRQAEHLLRLHNSLTAIGIENPHSEAEWQAIFSKIIEKNNFDDGGLYVQVTRGVAPRDHIFPERTQATVFAMIKALPEYDPMILEEGVKAITVEDIRWKLCNIKAISLLPNVLMRQQAAEAGCAEAIFIRESLVTEGAASNVFVVRDDVIMTPPKSQYLLPGITRDLILELAQQHGLAYREQQITRDQLSNAQEIWISSSLKELVPVCQLDEKAVGNGKPGPLWKKMHQYFQNFKQEFARGERS